MTRSARRRSSSRRSTSSMASLPAARSTSSPVRAPTSFTGGAFYEYSNNDLRGDSITADGSTRPVAPIEPDQRWGAYLGGPIIPNRLFFFAAYERQEAGQSQDDGPTGAGYANSDHRDQRGPVQPGVGHPAHRIRDRHRAAGHQPPVHQRALVRPARLADQRRPPPRADLSAARARPRSAPTISSPTRRRRRSPAATPSTAAARSPIIIRAASIRSGPTASRPSCAIRARPSSTGRIRSAAARRSRPIRSRASSSASTIPAVVDGTILAGPGTSRSANDLQTQHPAISRVWRTWRPATTASSSASSGTGPDLQPVRPERDRHAGFPQRRRPAGRPAVAGHSATTRPARSRIRLSAVRPRARSAISAPPATSPTPPRSSPAASIRSISRTIGTVNDPLDIVGGVRVDWYGGGHPTSNPHLPATLRLHQRDRLQRSRSGDPAARRLHLRFRRFRADQRAASCAAASASSPAAIRWSGSATPSRTTAAASPRARPRCRPGCPAGQIDVVVGGTFTGVPACIQADGIGDGRGRAWATPSRSIRTSSSRPCSAPISACRASSTSTSRLLQRLALQPRLHLQPLQQSLHDRRSVADHRDHRRGRRRSQRLHHRWPADLPGDRSDRGGLHGARWSMPARRRSGPMSTRPASTPPATTS